MRFYNRLLGPPRFQTNAEGPVTFWVYNKADVIRMIAIREVRLDRGGSAEHSLGPGTFAVKAHAGFGRDSRGAITVSHTVEDVRDGDDVIADSESGNVAHDFRLHRQAPGSAPGPLFVTDGTLFLIDRSGNLRMYRHDTQGQFEDQLGKVIPGPWSGYSWIGAARRGAHGCLYMIDGGGNLLYQDIQSDGTLIDRPSQIGSGWGMKWVGVNRRGQLHAITHGGDLLYYQHGVSPGDWQIAGAVIGNGWGGFSQVFAGGTNALYGITPDGKLLYYYHDDALTWKVSAMEIGSAWGGFSALASSGNGEIYGVLAGSGALRFYRHDVHKVFLNPNGTEIGRDIGTETSVGFAGDGRHGLIALAR